MARTWYVNGRFLTEPVAGAQRYALEVVRALDSHLADGHPLAQRLQVEIVAPRGATPPTGLREVQFRTAGPGGGHLWEQVVLARMARKCSGLLSLGNTGPLSQRKQIVCIHDDANTRTCPAGTPRASRTVDRVLQSVLGRIAARITTVSRHAAGRLAEHGVCSAAKIAVAANGHEHALRWIPSHSRATRAVAGPNTIVILGSPAPHKNIGLILGMAARLEEAGLKVAVAGMRCGPAPGEAPPPAAGCVSWLGRLTDNEFAALLRDSLCLAFPSLEEGSGLPVLEAMALQCPVVASNRSSLPEVCGSAALLASPFDGEAWLDAFLRLRSDARLRQKLIALGRLKATRYRWSRTAETYLEEMARLDGVPVAAPTAVDSTAPAAVGHAA